MIERKTGSPENSFHITKPPGASLHHAIDSLLSLRLPRPEGFVANLGETHLSLFVLEPKDIFGPVGYSTDTRRLFCYKAVFDDGAMAVMMITGDSLSNVLRDHTLQDSLSLINAEAMKRGGIDHHVICAVGTPMSRRNMIEFARQHHSQVVLQAAIQKVLAEPAGGLNYVDVKGVELAGWSPTSSSLPQCYVERMSEKPKSVSMTFVWARGDQHFARVSF
jgi:hypothetical protein